MCLATLKYEDYYEALLARAYLIRVHQRNISRKGISPLTLLTVQRISFSVRSSRSDARIIPFRGSRDFHPFRHARSSDLNCRGGSGVGVLQGYVNGTWIFPPSNVPPFFSSSTFLYARYDHIEITIKSCAFETWFLTFVRHLPPSSRGRLALVPAPR